MTALPGPALACPNPATGTRAAAQGTLTGRRPTTASAAAPAPRSRATEAEQSDTGDRPTGAVRPDDDEESPGQVWSPGPAQAAGPGERSGPAVADELMRRARLDRQATRAAGTRPTPAFRRRLAECRRDNAAALEAIVRRYGWPAVDVVGPAASTAALMILLHAPDLTFRLHCRDLIEQATADGRVPAVHFAYIADHCAVDLGEPQYYGTRVDPVTLRPYPIRCPETVDERRQDVGLGPLEEQMRALRLHR
ncbi:DUF6624 domain-containing protein [Streptomyces thermodiastaticus]|uniref:DUF6624 domain-containing protein n=1 Tax=Streptomyces thermoviolaceus TaxID=1952 RepID=UPI0019A17B57|nr:DUF6624 domain-containing protein [Streptomyces thermoviolaceus]GHA76317.1 hypothetical protein GCM10010512_03460 [Streptomyces thermoviolaceus subsp. thermoviolaceus]